MQRSNNNIERKGKELDKKQLAELEKIEFDVEQDLLRTLKEMYENERKGSQTFSDWLKSKPIDELRKIELKRGGIIKDPTFNVYSDGGSVKPSQYLELQMLLQQLSEEERKNIQGMLDQLLKTKDKK